MNPLFVAPILELGKSLLDRWFPDPQKKAEAEQQFMLLMQEQDFRKVIAQLEVNAKEAASPHLFVAGARPFVMWTCGVGFAWASIGHPVVSWFSAIKGYPPPPAIDADVLMYVLGGLLGLGGYRSYEKVKGVAS